VPTRPLSGPIAIEAVAPSSGANARIRRPLLAVALILATALLASCADQSDPSAPSKPLDNFSGELEAMRAEPYEVRDAGLVAEGREIYSCEHDSAGTLWHIRGSEAELLDRGHVRVGLVIPGGYFIAEDGSYLIGVTTIETPVEPGAMPWQRIAARINIPNDEQKGRFALVTSVRRVMTSGGMPPSPVCAQVGASLFVPFRATYLFYRTVPLMRDDSTVVTAPVVAPSIAVFRIEPLKSDGPLP